MNKFQHQLSNNIAYFLRPAQIFRNYKLTFLRPDLTAAVTLAVIMLPQAMAYALIADLPPQMGLYAAIIGSIVGALWGSSIHLQTGPSNAASLLVLSILLPIFRPHSSDYLLAAALLAFMAGMFRLLMGLANLGVVVNFVSDSVIVGFTSGAGVLILVNQLRNLLQLSIPSTPGLIDTIIYLVEGIEYFHLFSLILGLSVIGFILLLRLINRRLPAPLIAMILASLVVYVFNLNTRGIRVIGRIPSGLPPFTQVPVFNLQMVGDLAIGALALAAIGLVEAVSIARSIAAQSGQRLDSNQEFVGQGLANIAASLFSGYACSGSFVRSAVNYEAGGKTPLSNVFSGLLVLIIVLLFGWLTAFIPLTALAGVVIVISLNLIDIKEMRHVWNSSRDDRIIMLGTFLATLLLPLQFAVLTGIFTSIALYLRQTSTPRVQTVVPDVEFKNLIPLTDQPECPQLSIIEIRGDLYFGAVNHIEEYVLNQLKNKPNQIYLLLRLHGVEQLDISGIHALEHLVEAYREAGGDVYISRFDKPGLDIFDTSGFRSKLGEDHFIDVDTEAITYIFHHVLDPAICIYECPVKVFAECQPLVKRKDLVSESIHTPVPERKLPSIDIQTLWDDICSDHDFLIIDVREQREYRKAHIPGAEQVSMLDILRDPSIIPDDKPVVFYCLTGRRSRRVTDALKSSGFKNISVLEGGLRAWEQANLLEAIE